MANLSDGALVIDTGINNSGFFRDARQFKAAVASLKATINRVGQETGKSGGAFLRTIQSSARASRELQSEMQSLTRQAETLKAALDKPGTGSRAYKAMEDEIKGVEAQLRKAQQEMDAFFGPGAKRLNLDEFAAAKKNVDDLTAKLEELNRQRDRLGTPTAEDMSKYQEQVNAYNQAAEKVERMRQLMAEARSPWVGQWQQMETLSGAVYRGILNVRNAFGTLGMAIRHPLQAVDRLAGALVRMAGSAALSFFRKLAAAAKNAAIQLAKLAGRAVSGGIKKLAAYALGASRGLFGLGRGARDSGRGFQFSLKNLLKYGLGIRSLFVLFNRLRTAIKEGFSALSEYDPRVRSALASLSAALNGLKGSLASAFAPILTAAAPALTTLINLVTQAANALGMFFAALTGQSYYTAAKGVSSIGKAAGSSSGSVKELKRQLAGFDELNILSENAGGGGSGGGGGASSGMSFEKTPIGEGIRNFVESMKALVSAEDWDGLGRLLGDKVNGVLAKVRAMVSWDNLGERITQIVTGITGTINGLVDAVDWAKVGATFAEGLNTLVNTALLWIQGIDWARLGRSLGEGLNGLISRIDWAHVGDLIRAKLTALLDFTKNFVITFDEVEAAKKIREALGRVPWAQLASDFWETAKAAFKKVGNFVYVLLGGEIDNYDISAEDMLAEKLAIRNGRTGGGESWVRRLAQKIGEVIGSIPWKQIFEDAKKTIGEAITGLIDGLFGTEDGVFLAKFVGAIALLKIAIPALIGGLTTSITGALAALGIAAAIAAAAAVKKIIDAFDEIDKARRESVDNAVQSFGESYEKNPVAAVLGYEQAGYKGLVGKTKEEMEKRIELLQGLYNMGMSEKEANRTADEAEKGIKRRQEYLAKETVSSVASEFAKNFVDRGEYGDYTLGPLKLTDKMQENTKALGANTKATKEDTKATVQKDPGDRFAFSMAGGDYEGWNDLYRDELLRQDWQGALDAIAMSEATVDVNFKPKGTGAAGFVNNLGGYLRSVFAPGTDTDARVNLVRNAWSTIEKWVSGYSGGAFGQLVNLAKNGWTNVLSWTSGSGGGAFGQLVNLAKNGWTWVDSWTKQFAQTPVGQLINLAKNGWDWVDSWAKQYAKTPVGQLINLAKNGWTWVDTWAKQYAQTPIQQQVQLIKKPGNKLTYSMSQYNKANTSYIEVAATGGVATKAGFWSFATGGAIRGGMANWWGSVPKYAAGTARAHGTMFVAGEAGPEIVGHIGGRTEILNKSQLAQTMQSAVFSGMVAALRGITFTVPAMATGGIMPYEVSAQIAKSTADIQRTLDANNEDLIQTIISVAGQIVAAVHGIQAAPQAAAGMTAQQVINEINRRTQMFSASPLKGV